MKRREMAKVITPYGLMERVFAYKLLMNAVHLANLGLVWWLLGRLMPSERARLAAFTAFAWNPLMLFDVAGNAHNDGLRVTLRLLGVVPLVLTVTKPASAGGRARVLVRTGFPNMTWLLGVLSIGLSALVKYTSALVGLFYLVAWARQLASWRRSVAWIAGAGLRDAVSLRGGIDAWSQEIDPSVPQY